MDLFGKAAFRSETSPGGARTSWSPAKLMRIRACTHSEELHSVATLSRNMKHTAVSVRFLMLIMDGRRSIKICEFYLHQSLQRSGGALKG